MSESLETGERLDLQLIALLLHDLESPLAVAKQFFQRVEHGRHDPSEPRHQRLFTSTRLAFDRAERILADVLDQARNGSCGLVAHKQPLDLHALIQDCIRMLAPLFDDKELQIRAELDDRIPAAVSLDAGLLGRVIDNFLVNAIRHAPVRTPITVRSRLQDKQVRVEVWNRATDDFNADLDDIFNPVRQIKLRTERSLQGSGLGLTFSRMAVEAHGGTVGAHRHLNDDVNFWLQIPMA